MGRRQSKGLTPEQFRPAAECLKVLAHPHRLYMLQLLLEGEHSVGELASSCEILPHVTSEHLRTMERCGFLEAEKRGREVYYRVIESHVKEILRCIHSRFGT